MGREHVPGIAVGIYSRGKVLLAKGYGMSNVELSVPVKPETVFQSGSIGKQFASAAVMMLVEDGKVSLDDSITKYFTDAPAAWKPILVKNLLSHTSGLSEYETPERTGRGGVFDWRMDFTEDDFVKKIEVPADRKRARRQVGLPQHQLPAARHLDPPRHRNVLRGLLPRPHL